MSSVGFTVLLPWQTLVPAASLDRALSSAHARICGARDALAAHCYSNDPGIILCQPHFDMYFKGPIFSCHALGGEGRGVCGHARLCLGIA